MVAPEGGGPVSIGFVKGGSPIWNEGNGPSTADFLQKKAIARSLVDSTWGDYVTAVLRLREVVYEVLGESYPDQEEVRLNSPQLFSHIVAHVRQARARAAEAKTKAPSASAVDGPFPSFQTGEPPSVNPVLKGPPPSGAAIPYPPYQPPGSTPE